MADYASALRDINSPGTGYFVPAVNIISMSITDLTNNYNSLASQIQMWTDRYNSGNSKEKNNINQILAVQRSKFDAYAQAIQDYNDLHSETPVRADDVTVPAGDGTPAASSQSSVNPPAPVKESNLLKYLLIGGLIAATIAAAYVIIKKRKHGTS